MPQLRVIVYGRVQGVNFRQYTALKARELELTGWVRNLADGTVETVAVGEHSALDRFLGWLHEGSPLARVTNLEAIWMDSGSTFSGFEIRHEHS